MDVTEKESKSPDEIPSWLRDKNTKLTVATATNRGAGSRNSGAAPANRARGVHGLIVNPETSVWDVRSQQLNDKSPVTREHFLDDGATHYRPSRRLIHDRGGGWCKLAVSLTNRIPAGFGWGNVEFHFLSLIKRHSFLLYDYIKKLSKFRKIPYFSCCIFF